MIFLVILVKIPRKIALCSIWNNIDIFISFSVFVSLDLIVIIGSFKFEYCIFFMSVTNIFYTSSLYLWYGNLQFVTRFTLLMFSQSFIPFLPMFQLVNICQN